MNPPERDKQDETDENRTTGRKRPYQPSDEATESDSKRPSQSEIGEAEESSSSRWSGNDPPAQEAGASAQQFDDPQEDPPRVSQSLSGSESRARAPAFNPLMFGGNIQDPSAMVSSANSVANHNTNNVLISDASSIAPRSALNNSLQLPLHQSSHPSGLNQTTDQSLPPGLVANPFGLATFAGTTSAELMHLYQLNLMQLMSQQQATMNPGNLPGNLPGTLPGTNPMLAPQALNPFFAANAYNSLLYQQTLPSMTNDAQRLQQLAGLLPGTASAASLPLGGVTGNEATIFGASRSSAAAAASLSSLRGLNPSAYREPVKPPEGPILYLPTDDDILSEQQCLLRKQIEIFAADEDDICAVTPGRRKEIVLGQVGIRCKYCAHVPVHTRTKGAVYYPAKLKGIYQASQNMSVSHFCDACENIDPYLKAELRAFQQGKSTSGHGGKQYWADSAKVLGVIETEDEGLRFDPSRAYSNKKMGRARRN